MKDGYIRVAATTPAVRVADPKYNEESCVKAARDAADEGAQIIVLPELVLSGYTCQDLFLQRTLTRECERQLLRFAEDTRDIEALSFVGLPLMVNDKLYNAAAAVYSGEIMAFIPKLFLPNYGEFYEVRHFRPGLLKPELISFNGKRIPFGSKVLLRDSGIGLTVGAELCEDVWTPDTPSTRHAMRGANVIVNLSASNELVAKDEYRRMLVLSTSARLICAYVYASAGEGESTQDLVFSGHNLIAENGAMAAESARFDTGCITADIDLQRLSHLRSRMNSFDLVEDDDYCFVDISLKERNIDLKRRYPRLPFVPEGDKDREKRCNEILTLQALGLKKRLESIGCKKAVVGLSGGLDSTLALLVMVKAFDMLGYDKKGLICVTMPCFGTTDRTYNNACRLAGAVGATLMEINIEKAVRQHFSDIGQDENVQDVTYENCQARERTQVLMDVANKEGAIVVGTGDLSELALGWATYNGDHMSMYGVNCSVPKTLVRHLVRFYADTAGDEEVSHVLSDVLDTPVSPELIPPKDGVISQRTEDIVGPYELHDFFLYYMLRCGFSPRKLYRVAKLAFEGSYDDETILKWERVFIKRFFAQQFKRSCLPDGPKVGSVALSPRGDLRMPSDASAALWLKELEEIRVR